MKGGEGKVRGNERKGRRRGGGGGRKEGNEKEISRKTERG